MKGTSKTSQMLPLAQHRKTRQACNTRSCAEAALRVLSREERVRGGDAAPPASFPFEDNNFQRGVHAATEGAILLPLLLYVIYVQELLQRFRESACGSSFL